MPTSVYGNIDGYHRGNMDETYIHPHAEHIESVAQMKPKALSERDD